eukprot:GHVN01078813.1.p1 GENE.GHVN01078813.1~~GHVN01078813.1.p1  ORF type:complete len:261 (-),score=33.35 GHVN01078813.1:190-972(-)
MFTTRSEYDRGVNTFSPEGRLFQVEYALGAIKLGSTAVGIATSEGVVLASERRVNASLLEAKSIEKILEIDVHVGCAMSGLMADARTLIDHARVECQNHHFTYNERMPVESCVQTISDLALDFSDVKESNRKKTMSRPFGVALLVAGVDRDGPVLWCTDPSGTNTRFEAAAVGSAQDGAEGMLQEQFSKGMSLKQAEELALVVLRHVMEETLSASNVEIATVPISTKKFHIFDDTEVGEVISRLPSPSQPSAAQLTGGSR